MLMSIGNGLDNRPPQSPQTNMRKTSKLCTINPI